MPTAAPGANNGQAASTAFVAAAITAGGGGGSSYAVLYTAQALNSSQQLQARQNIAAIASGDSHVLGNGSTATTQAAGDNTTKVATDAFVTGAVSSYAGTVAATYAPLASPAFTGSPKAVTASAGDSSTTLATTAYADRAATNAAAAVPAPTYTYSPVRQTVQIGPAASGLPSFLPASTSGTLTLTFQNVSPTAPLITSVAKGFGSNGAVDAVSVFTANPSVTLPASQSFVGIYWDQDASTWGASTLPPIYQAGGTVSTLSGQYTFDYVAMVGWVGNGSTAVRANRVYVGEAATSASAVTSTAAYAYQGQYDSGWTATLPGAGSSTVKPHNLGLQSGVRRFILECTAADIGYVVGDQIDERAVWSYNGTYGVPPALASSRTTLTFVIDSNSSLATHNKATAGGAVLTLANWRWKLIAQRPF